MTIDHQLIRSEAKDYIFSTLGLMLYAAAFTIFLLPYEIVTGGVMGMSSIIFYATGFRIENSYMIINICLLIVGLKILGFKFLMKTIYAIVALYFMIKFAQDLMPVDSEGHFIKILGEGQEFMSLIVGCCLTGTALAIVFLNNSSTGGTDIIAWCVNKYRDVSLGQVLMMVDVMIISSSLLFPQFGDMLQRVYKVVFGLSTMIVECFMIDHVMNLRRQSVQFLIFSSKYALISEAITKETDHSVTLLDGEGWYTGNEMKVVCLLAKKSESAAIFRLIKIIDPNAFVSQSAVIGVFGEGFDRIKVSVPKKKSMELISENEHLARERRMKRKMELSMGQNQNNQEQ